ncbi:MAG: RNB domain-containing ribonuclease, partial [Rikenellaceae bacterium]
YYTHFTSPIRRYPDMMVHRLLAHYLDGGKSLDKEPIEELCVHSSEREIVAANAERASIKYKAVEFMRDRMNEEFDGHISGMKEWGVFVEIDDTHIEGMIPVRDLGDDYFEFDEKNYTMYGRSTREKFTLGDAVRVKIKRADLGKRMLDFVLVERL